MLLPDDITLMLIKRGFDQCNLVRFIMGARSSYIIKFVGDIRYNFELFTRQLSGSFYFQPERF